VSQVRPPSINLSRRPFRNNSVYYGVFITCGLLLSVASSYNVYDFVVVGGEISRLREDLTEREQKYMELRDEVDRMKRDVSKLDLNTLNQKSAFANGLILSKLFSWSTLFDRIEDLMPPQVKIRSIRPSISAKGGIEILIDGMASGPEDLYAFESALVNSEYFAAVYPVSESSKESRTEINFDLAMKYLPAGRPPAGTVAAKLPSTPTEGLPQPEPPDPNQAAAAAPSDANGTAGQAASEPPAAASTTQAQPQAQAQAQAPPESAPETPSEPAQPPKATSKSPPLLTNKEFLEELGEERFIRARGNLKPASGGRDSQLTNEEFLKKHGKEEFLKERGGLTRSQMNPPIGGAVGSKAPGGAP